MAYSLRTTAPFRADLVGSFLRPAKLKQARLFFRDGIITKEQLTQVEDECIKDLVQKQIASGLELITDGEFRRSWWHFDFFWGLNGVKKSIIKKGYAFHDEETRPETARLVGKISGENHPFVEHFKFLYALKNDKVLPRQTIPAPAQLLAVLLNVRNNDETSNLRDIYPDDQSLIDDIAKAYRQVISDLYQAGCRNVQFDDCTWPVLCDENFVKAHPNLNVDELLEKYLAANNQALEGAPSDLSLTTHICRGNYHSTYFAQGGYDKVAKLLFGSEKVSAFYLEYDDERSGDFKPLALIPQDKLVVLGLITSKRPELEDKEIIKKRILEASKYIDLDRLCLSPQCGFSSTEEGNKLTEDDEWKKIKLVQEIAHEVWY